MCLRWASSKMLPMREEPVSEWEEEEAWEEVRPAPTGSAFDGCAEPILAREAEESSGNESEDE